MLRFEKSESCNYQYVVATVDESRTRISRDELLKVLHAENILAKRYFYPGCHRLIPKGPGEKEYLLPVTESLVQKVLVLPGGAAIGANEIDGVCETVRSAVAHGAEIQEAFTKGATFRAVPE